MHANEAMLRDIDEQMLRGDIDSYWAAHTRLSDALSTSRPSTSARRKRRGRTSLESLNGRRISCMR